MKKYNDVRFVKELEVFTLTEVEYNKFKFRASIEFTSQFLDKVAFIEEPSMGILLSAVDHSENSIKVKIWYSFHQTKL